MLSQDSFGRANNSQLSIWDLYLLSTSLRSALSSSIKAHSVNGARCAALRFVLQDCLDVGEEQERLPEGIGQRGQAEGPQVLERQGTERS
jgi:hypothetical protein